MKRIIKYILLIISLILFYYLLITNSWLTYNMTYTKTLIFMLSTCLFVFITGIVINKEAEYKINVYCYILLFLMLLYSFVFIIGRPAFRFYDNFHFTAQLKPFYTITNEIKWGSTFSVMKNVSGNLVALIPLSFLLMIRSKKFNNILIQSLIIIPTIIFIELFQAYSHTGAFDIDDFILNYMGVVVFTFLITRFHIIDKIRDVFYKDFNIKEKTKNILFYISTIFIIIVDIAMFIK